MTSAGESLRQDVDGLPCFRARRLGHVNLLQTNLLAVSDFYREVAGVGLHYHKDDQGFFHTNGNTYHDLGLLEAGSEGRSRLNHLAFELENEADLVHGYDVAISRGVTVYPYSHDVAHAVYLGDPDGNEIEIYADIESNWRELRAGNVNEKPHDVAWQPGASEPLTESRYPVSPELTPVAGAVFAARRVYAATLVAKDFPAMLEFYTKLVGLDVLHGAADAPFAALGGTTAEPTLILVREATGRPAGLHHFSWQVGSAADLDAALPRLALSGHDVVADVTWRGRRSVFVRDPNGILLQFFADQQPVIRDVAALHPDLALFVL